MQRGIEFLDQKATRVNCTLNEQQEEIDSKSVPENLSPRPTLHAEFKTGTDAVVLSLEEAEACLAADEKTANQNQEEPHRSNSSFVNKLATIHDTLEHKWVSCKSAHSQKIWKTAYFILAVGFSVYLLAASWHDISGATPILVLTSFVVFMLVYGQVSKLCGDTIRRSCMDPCQAAINRNWKCLKWLAYLSVIAALVAFFILDTGVRQLYSAAGLLGFVFITLITSKYPTKVYWRPVLWGFGLQFLIGLFVLRWPLGYSVLEFISNQVEKFLSFTDVGSKFVFGDKGYLMHIVAFKILPVVIYFSSVISILYHLGVMQIIIQKLAWLMQLTMGTTAVESLSAAANIFLGQVAATVILRPFMVKLTASELHSVLTGGFATISGSVIAAYIQFGAPGEHILAAAIMSSPAALAIAKLGFPEVDESSTKTDQDVKLENTSHNNVIDAASHGALMAVKLISGVVVNLISFLALLAFLNAVLSYLGSKVGFPQLSFQLICSYVFMPVAAMMGVEWRDTGKVASLLGTKIFLNEFIAFKDLGEMIQNGELQGRSVVISTYALCGFGSVAALGINLGAFTAMSPERRGEIALRMPKALIAGNIACFMTACIAGVIYRDDLSLQPANTTDFIPGNMSLTTERY